MSLDGYPQLDGKQITALGFDFGTQRIGVAFGQSLTGTAQAVTIIKAKVGKPNWDEVENLLTQWRPDVLVVGLPFNMDGSDSELLVRAKKFAARLHGRFGKPCFGMDERLSSVEAEELRNRDGDTAKKSTAANKGAAAKKRAAIDDIAAQIILENWLTELKAHQV